VSRLLTAFFTSAQLVENIMQQSTTSTIIAIIRRIYLVNPCVSPQTLYYAPVVADHILLHAFKKTTAAWGKGEE
jgi:hypothetical protein